MPKQPNQHTILDIARIFVIAMLLFTGQAQAALPIAGEEGRPESPFARVFEKVSPAVVKIIIKGVVEVDSEDGPWWLSQDSRRRRPYSGMGSGVVIDRDGHIITNNHVIVRPDGSSAADNILVTFSTNEEYDAEVVGRDPESDLAVIRLKLDGKQLPESKVAVLGDSDAIKPGDYAIAIGNPLGLERTITVGVVSATGRYSNIRPTRGGEQLQFRDFIQTDALINPGNSGGALCDIEGNIIGINDMYIANSGIGFAIPSNLAKRIAAQIMEHGMVKRGAVGIQISDVSRDNQEAFDLPDRDGAFVLDVLPGTPAERAGIKTGDVIVSLNGERLENSNEFMLKVGDLPPGTMVELAVLQEGALKNLSLTLADRQETISIAQSEQWRGIHVADISQSTSENFDISGIDDGVVVVDIDANSPAADTSLETGDVIVEVNGEPVGNVRDFVELRERYSESRKPMLIYRLRKQPNGRIGKGFVAVKSS